MFFVALLVVVFPSLEELRLEWNENVKELWHGKFSENICQLKVLELIAFPKKASIFPSSFFHTSRNLEKLVVSNAFFEEIFLCKGFGCEEINGEALSELRVLKLSALPELLHLWKENSQPSKAFQNLMALEVSGCSKLHSLVPSTVSFHNLISLEVSMCDGMKNLMTLSTAKSLVRLTKINISYCKMIEGIIEHAGDEVKEPITFSQLKYLGLHCLPSLGSFYSGSCTLEFPSLEDVIVGQCPKMQIFSLRVSSTPKLQSIQIKEGEHVKGNLNSIIQQLFELEMVGYHSLEHLNLSEFDHLKEIWHGQPPVVLSFFHNLRSLVLHECSDIWSAIPAELIWHLNNLETLDVSNCDSLSQMFDLEGLNVRMLKESHQEILGFKNLKSLKVHCCNTLRYIFTPTLISSLVKLEVIEVTNCIVLEDIIIKEGEKDATIEKIVIPQLKSIILESLPNLTSFYSGDIILDCPSLNDLSIKNCLNIEAFVSDNVAFLFNEKVVFPILEEMRLEWNDNMRELWHGKFS